MHRRRREQSTNVFVSDSKSLQVIGPFNTGTNLMYSLLSNKTKSFKIDFIWKHEINFSSLEHHIKDNRKKFIIMYKPIYNWIYSIKKASYDIKFLENGIHGKVLFKQKIYKNIIEVYNLYYQMYLKILTCPNVIFINYYKLISDDGLDYLNNKLQKIGIEKLDLYEYNTALSKPAKNHGRSVKNANEALDRFDRVNEEYKQKVCNSELVHSLDLDLYKILDNL
jgi:hypothetical protein